MCPNFLINISIHTGLSVYSCKTKLNVNVESVTVCKHYLIIHKVIKTVFPYLFSTMSDM
jgi:hypothetical protein